MSNRLEKALADVAEQRARIAKLECRNLELESQLKAKDSELDAKTRDITLLSREAALQVKEEIQTKVKEAWQRGFDTATRNFEKISRMHAPPSSARIASFGRDSWRSESGDD